MAIIQLTKGYTTEVDDDMLPFLTSRKWQVMNKARVPYARSHGPNSEGHKTILLHHFIAGFPLKGFAVDHIDGNGLNNKRSNLRVVSWRQNCLNRYDKRALKTWSQYPGVTWDKARGKWKVQALVNGKRIQKRFTDETLAAKFISAFYTHE